MVRIRFESIKVDKLSDSSSVNSGLNVIIGRYSRDQRNEVMGASGNSNRIEAGQHVTRTESKRPSSFR